MTSSERCPECFMFDGLHTSDCPVRLAAKQVPKTGNEAVLADLAKWMADRDVQLIINATLRRYQVAHLGELPDEVIHDLHEAIGIMLAESPTITSRGDPRRMV